MFAKNGGADGISTINTVAGLTGVGLDDHVLLLNVFGKGAMSGFRRRLRSRRPWSASPRSVACSIDACARAAR
jgi:hypothetical protein